MTAAVPTMLAFQAVSTKPDLAARHAAIMGCPESSRAQYWAEALPDPTNTQTPAKIIAAINRIKFIDPSLLLNRPVLHSLLHLDRQYLFPEFSLSKPLNISPSIPLVVAPRLFHRLPRLQYVLTNIAVHS